MRRTSWVATVILLAIVAGIAALAGLSGQSDSSSGDGRSETVRPDATTPAPVASIRASDAVANGGIPEADFDRLYKNARIVGGTPVSIANYSTRYRSVVALNVSGGLCGGTAVADRWVLTAAHCVVRNGVPLTTDKVKVLAGCRALNCPAPFITTAKIVAHPNYVNASKLNDIALVQTTAPMNVPVQQVAGTGDGALWGNESGKAASATTGAWIAGWGDSDIRPSQTSILADMREGLIPIASQTACRANFQKITTFYAQQGYAWPAYNATSHLCAGQLSTNNNPAAPNGVDTCQGDSGGPLIVSNGAGVYKQVGVVSFGHSCGDIGYGVYTKVPNFQTFITNTITGAGGVIGGGPVGDPNAVPSAPQTLAYVKRGVTELSFGWKAPTTGVAARYKVFEVASGRNILLGSVAATGARVYRLRPARVYCFYVTAVNAAGAEGPATPTQCAKTQRDTFRPSRPGTPVLMSKTQTSLKFKFAQSRDVHSSISRYVVQQMRGRTVVRAQRLSAASGGAIAFGLRSNTTYYYRVLAYDTAGNVSLPSAVRAMRTR